MTESNQITEPNNERRSLVARLVSDRFQWLATHFLFAGSAIDAGIIYSWKNTYEHYGNGSYVLLAISTGFAVLGLAYTVDNIISHYQNRSMTHMEEAVEKHIAEETEDLTHKIMDIYEHKAHS